MLPPFDPAENAQVGTFEVAETAGGVRADRW
jgi:hypothetical protein